MGKQGGIASGNRRGSVWARMSASFWFVPSILTIAGFLLSFVTQPLDQLLQGTLDRLPTVVSGGASGASMVLSAISGSLITVIATVFSLTIVTLTLASGQYSPRLLQSFVADRGLQVVLGTYIGTFVYSLMVLRLVSASGGEASNFNPVVSVAVATILALLCVALLIYFISHVANIIQSGAIVLMAHEDTMGLVASLDDLEDSGETIRDPAENPRWAELLAEEPSVVRARNSGYVVSMNPEEILETVVGEETKVVEIVPGPGLFVSAGLPILKIWPATDEKLVSDAGQRVNRAFVFDKERNFQQDLAFGLRQLSDVALKGLSPGINDPTTAMQAMDRMEAVFVALGSRSLPNRVQLWVIDGNEVLVKAGYQTFGSLLGLAFDQVRRAAFTSGQVAVLERLLEILDHALQTNAVDDRQQVLWDGIFAIARQAPREISDPYDTANLILRAVQTTRNMTMKQRVRSDKDLEKLVELSEDLPDEGEIQGTVNLFHRRVG
ncbi:MAG: DUF2254 domain-containing protein [Rubrobacteraceae bacterium]